jgi:hypothetical protein
MYNPMTWPLADASGSPATAAGGGGALSAGGRGGEAAAIHQWGLPLAPPPQGGIVSDEDLIKLKMPTPENEEEVCATSLSPPEHIRLRRWLTACCRRGPF